jgi:RNA polymerase sigma-70 factor (ECF subfamily)
MMVVMTADPETFVRLLTECQSRLYAYIATIVPDFVAANEVLSETNAALWRKSSDFQVGTEFSCWALRVAYFEVLAYQKRRRSDRHIFDGELLAQLADRAAELSEDFCERRLALRGCMQKLSSRNRELLNLRYHSGVPVQEIAQRRGKSPNAISHMLFRIRSTLAECIERTLGTEPTT